MNLLELQIMPYFYFFLSFRYFEKSPLIWRVRGEWNIMNVSVYRLQHCNDINRNGVYEVVRLITGVSELPQTSCWANVFKFHMSVLKSRVNPQTIGRRTTFILHCQWSTLKSLYTIIVISFDLLVSNGSERTSTPHKTER